MPVYRVTVHVPPAHLDRLTAAIGAVEGLRLGDYDQVLWIAAPGLEQFRPLPGALPGLGRVGEVTRTESVRVEFAMPRDPVLLQRVLEQAVWPQHPWEMPAVFVDETLLPLPARSQASRRSSR